MSRPCGRSPTVDTIRDLVQRRIELAGGDPDARLFTGPRGGRITTATLRDASCWDEVVTKLGYDELKRHSLRHTGLMTPVCPFMSFGRSPGTPT
ncbi:MAG: hypothetical protein ACLP3C_29010 [Mycobacterium sp.]|uniref:hypothetical protein n=1 Tax=Mycobacterium sp. TaxID=1785 RepID=UPI003F94F649